MSGLFFGFLIFVGSKQSPYCIVPFWLCLDQWYSTCGSRAGCSWGPTGGFRSVGIWSALHCIRQRGEHWPKDQQCGSRWSTSSHRRKTKELLGSPPQVRIEITSNPAAMGGEWGSLPPFPSSQKDIEIVVQEKVMIMQLSLCDVMWWHNTITHHNSYMMQNCHFRIWLCSTMVNGLKWLSSC